MRAPRPLTPIRPSAATRRRNSSMAARAPPQTVARHLSGLRAERGCVQGAGGAGEAVQGHHRAAHPRLREGSPAALRQAGVAEAVEAGCGPEPGGATALRAALRTGLRAAD